MNTEDLSAEELTERARAGDRNAFGRLYSRHYRDVYKQVRHRVPNTAVAEDLTHDVFVRALNSIAGFEWAAGGFGAWLSTIARNLVRDYWKSAHVRRTEYLDSPEYPRPEAADDYRFADPAASVVSQLEAHELRLNLLRLKSEAQAEAMLYRYIDELTVTETAAVLGCEEGAVKSLCFRAMRELRTVLMPA